ncbi:polysaccharide biosynthesis protein [Streptomyces sp. NPDC097619]|uniref:polysaccharide biosynthesis protein n=1 Tax=Streptomyces sp. NPDC097619 TaxID=3157228 RepID=UPI003318D974
MSDDTIRLVTIGRILRRRRRLLTVLAMVGALLGYGTSLLFPPRYTTSVSVLLPGAWEERELLTQAEIATSSVVADRTAATLGWPGTGGAELRDLVAAQATDGNIIKITGTAETPERAQELTDELARQFVGFAAKMTGDTADPEAAARPEALRKLVTQTGRRITELSEAVDPGRTVEGVQARTELAKLRTALQEAITKLDQADPASTKSSMVVMGQAARPDGEAPPTALQLVPAGAVSAVLLGIVGHLTAARVSRRLRTGPEIAAVLGATVLGAVDVPVDRAVHRSTGPGPRDRIRRLLGLDVRWNAPALRAAGDEAGTEIRYRRVHDRIEELVPGPRRLLVLVPEGDELGRSAAGRLAAVGEDAPGNAGGDPQDGHSPALRVVEAPVTRPMVPDRAGEAGALVVLSADSWTGEELGGLAAACADAGHEIVGAVLAGPVLARPARTGGRRRGAAKTPAGAGDEGTGIPE